MTSVRDQQTRRRVAWRVLFAAVGLGFLAFLVHASGPAAMVPILRGSLAFLPALLLIELVRIAGEAFATARILGVAASRFPRFFILRAQLISYAFCNGLPAGRAAAEAAKGALFSKVIGPAVAAAVAAGCQEVSFFANAAVSFLCGAAAWWATGFSPLTVAVIVQGAINLVAGALLRLAVRGRMISRWLARVPSISKAARAIHEAALHQNPWPWVPFAAHVGVRLLQVVQFGVLLAAISAPLGVVPAFLAQAVNLVTAGAADIVPGQVGATEGAFSLAAPLFGIEPVRAVTLGLLYHVVQLTFIAVAVLVPLLWPAPATNVDERPGSG